MNTTFSYALGCPQCGGTCGQQMAGVGIGLDVKDVTKKVAAAAVLIAFSVIVYKTFA